MVVTMLEYRVQVGWRGDSPLSPRPPPRGGREQEATPPRPLHSPPPARGRGVARTQATGNCLLPSPPRGGGAGGEGARMRQPIATP